MKSTFTQHSTDIWRDLAKKARCCNTCIFPNSRNQLCYVLHKQRNACTFFIVQNLRQSTAVSVNLEHTRLHRLADQETSCRKVKVFLSFLYNYGPICLKRHKIYYNVFFSSFSAVSPIRMVSSNIFLAFHCSTLSQISTWRLKKPSLVPQPDLQTLSLKTFGLIDHFPFPDRK